MIILIDSCRVAEIKPELSPYDVGEFITPLTSHRYQGHKFAIDNGSFSNFRSSRFLNLVKRQRPYRSKCLFVTVPDKVGSHDETVKLFNLYAPTLSTWPRAFVLQDGCNKISSVPWDKIIAIFVGGSTEYKLSLLVEEIIQYAKSIGKWVHVGRVNTPKRFKNFLSQNVDSIDGSGISRFSDARKALLCK